MIQSGTKKHGDRVKVRTRAADPHTVGNEGENEKDYFCVNDNAITKTDNNFCVSIRERVYYIRIYYKLQKYYSLSPMFSTDCCELNRHLRLGIVGRRLLL